jgi:hypothetical protein
LLCGWNVRFIAHPSVFYEHLFYYNHRSPVNPRVCAAAGVFSRLFPVSPGPRRLNIQKSIISAGGPSITEKSIENPSGR